MPMSLDDAPYHLPLPKTAANTSLVYVYVALLSCLCENERSCLFCLCYEIWSSPLFVTSAYTSASCRINFPSPLPCCAFVMSTVPLSRDPVMTRKQMADTLMSARCLQNPDEIPSVAVFLLLFFFCLFLFVLLRFDIETNLRGPTRSKVKSETRGEENKTKQTDSTRMKQCRLKSERTRGGRRRLQASQERRD